MDTRDDTATPQDAPQRTGRVRLRPTGGYRRLAAFQISTLIYDGTVTFCRRFVDSSSRTQDQMIQAARSGRQNIAEGNRAGAVSSTSEIRLTNVARASLEELLLDVEDYLRQHDLPLWDKNARRAKEIRRLGSQLRSALPESPLGDPADRGDRARLHLYKPYLDHELPEVPANTLICLIHQASYLLDRLLLDLEQKFIHEGGFSEQIAAARIEQRNQSFEGDPLPRCPKCGAAMSQRTARQGTNKGQGFWGCSKYPACKGTRPLDGE